MSPAGLENTSVTMYTNTTRSLLSKLNVLKQGIALNKTSTATAQIKLPNLPVPTLQQTLDKFLLTAQPHLSQDELKRTQNVVKQFLEKEGPVLQGKLIERAKRSGNWLKDWWLQTAYLGYRDPVVIFSSPGLVIPFVQFKNETERLAHAAKMIAGAIGYKLLIDNDQMPQEKSGKDLLDMSQYKRVFGTCRNPAMGLDILQFNPDSKHIIVAHNNQFFKVDVFGSDGTPLNVNQLIQQLKWVLEQSQEIDENPVGLLTSEYRDNWARAYEILKKDPKNKESLDSISRSLFLMCLDKVMPNPFGFDKHTLINHQLIHGGGSEANSGNRWFDKTLQFVVSPDGFNGLTYEHSPAEGQPVAVMTDYIINFIKGDKGANAENAHYSGAPLRLDFNVNEEVKEAIAKAKININKLRDNLDMNSGTFTAFGKEFVKSQKLSPDSFIQIAMQYAFYRLHQVPAAHYESASTRKYIDGRTETIRSCSNESIAFAKTMLDQTATSQEKVDRLKAAITGHKKYMVEAMNGFGVDRHLLGLKLIAQEMNINLPALYSDPSYLRSSRMRLSTSQVALSDGYMCYAPLVTDGYSCCYNPRKDTMNFAVGSFVEDPNTKAALFRRALEESLLDMRDILVKTTKAKL